MTAAITAARATGVRSARSYMEILRSSALVGGSQVIVVLFTILRTKVMAVLLGPAGFGLLGLYSAIADLGKSVAEVGINSSGVRQIAAAAGSGDSQRIARTITALRRTALVLAVLGVAMLTLLSAPLSQATFGNSEHAGGIALLSLAVALRLIADAHGALVQGMRRVADLARIAVYGAAVSTPIAIAFVYLLREDGVVPALVAVAACTAVASWWYSRRVPVPAVSMSVREVGHESAELLKLGSAFMASAMLMMAAAWVVRLMVVRLEGLEAAGYFQAAWALGGLYVGMIVQAMGADFYPRLTGAIADSREVVRLVNEQAEISMLLAGPGVLGTLALAPLLMVAFYSSEFIAAAELLRLICLGMALRIVSWPIGYIIVARGDRVTFFLTELAWCAANVLLSWAALRAFGLQGAGIAFFASYVIHVVLIYAIVRRSVGFRWSPDNLRIASVFVTLTMVALLGFWLLPAVPAVLGGLLVAVAGGLYSLDRLLDLVTADQLPVRLRALFVTAHQVRGRLLPGARQTG